MSGAVVVEWSGREVRALRLARRMSIRSFSEHLGGQRPDGVEVGGRPGAHPSAPGQSAALDESLQRAELHEQERFNAALSMELAT